MMGEKGGAVAFRLSVRDKIWGRVALFVLGMIGLSAVDIRASRNALMDEKKLQTRHLVESAHAVVVHFATLEQAGELSRAEAQAKVQRTLRAMRYENTEYFWINDFTKPVPRMLMHPTLPLLDGQVLDAEEFNCASSQQVGTTNPVVRTNGRKNLFVAFNEVVRQGGHGFVTYHWPKPLAGGGATAERYPKLSYVKGFDNWGWVIGSGIYIDDVDQAIREHALKNMGLVFALGGLLVALAAWLGRSITRPLGNSARALHAMTHGQRPLGPLLVEREDEIGTLIAGFNHLQEVLRTNEDGLRLSASVFEHAHEGIVITDPRGKIIGVNPSFTKLTGYGAEEVIGRSPSLLKSGHQGPEFYAQMWQALAEQGHWQGEISNRRKDGAVYVEMLTITSVHDAAGNLSHYLGIFSDVTALKEQQQRLEHMAHYDALTQLPNRILLADRLQLALIQAGRKHDLLAVAFLDLDEFKPVNDRLGHEAGDRLLIEVAQRLKHCVRAGDTVARLGGDEFVLLLVGLEDVQEAHGALERVLATLAVPLLLCGEPVSISASIGVTLYPLDGADPDVLLRHADQAMYAAKQAGRNRYHLFDLEQDQRAHVHREWLADIRKALAANEFELFYQPKANLRRGQVVGAEALIRWHHPERGLLLPDTFLPVIEGSDLCVTLGDWVIETALTQMECWQRAGLILPVSVNVAACQLQEDNFVAKLATALARHPELARFSLELEILETAALEDIDHISHVIENCIDLGVTFALDDFGTGYSSLTYFKRLPAKVLKIDKSFVIDMLNDPDDLAIVEGVIGFTQAFQREVIAEGVETREHAAMLLHLGCELAQGYGIARPMPAAALPDWIAAFHPDPVWGGETQELNRIHFPLLHAESDHRRWVERLEAVVTEGNNSVRKPPPLDPHHCAFGRWLDGPGRDRYGDTVEFGAINRLHRRVHELGEEIVELHQSAETATIQPRLKELHGLRDALVADLRTLREIATRTNC
jgi:diguanylate cyclase (GGDEF)-like protein/PAS domain S-box-containing protein